MNDITAKAMDLGLNDQIMTGEECRRLKVESELALMMAGAAIREGGDLRKDLEACLVMLAFQSGEITVQRAADLMDTDIPGVRGMLAQFVIRAERHCREAS